ncbi:hypothetical protein J2T02_003963 [Chitinophaga terrae (ex Kim and Jung 2007)]|uniref:hypothetical protein n=1 Tax=Chitinophaga terrae (ex Kim and Jung 2007) TaxID=408074 RepID=UPI00278596D0|nr:hypothetical protein [Chitinophaga terrae (ex Kim and Jung 2007)]MDQ0108823.1 hypothetical protein [Chitinophaga terrae (ex Kim and Jung 2007)]
MKGNLKAITLTLALGIFSVGLVTSFSSFKADKIFLLTDTGTGTGTDSGTDIKDAVLVSGIDCSWKDAVYDPSDGTLLGYNVYTASYSECKPGTKTCKETDQKICTVTAFKFEKK